LFYFQISQRMGKEKEQEKESNPSRTMLSCSSFYFSPFISFFVIIFLIPQ
jgi:hypothetical protein